MYPSDEDLDREQSPRSGRNRKKKKPAPDIFRDATAVYDYTDEHGVLLYQVARDAEKNFAQRRPNVGRDPKEPKWIYETKSVRRVLYRLPEVLAAIDLQKRGKLNQPIFVVEGEKDADNLARLGLVATTAAMGAVAPWLPEYSEQLSGSAAVVIPDNDKPGREHGEAVASAVVGRVASLRVLSLPAMKEGGDVSDWIASGGTREKLLAMASEVPLYSNPVKRFASIAIGMHAFLKKTIEKPISVLGEGVISAFHVVMLVGRGGAGKSWLALMIGRAIARGASFFGLATPKGGAKVGILELEDHAYDYQQRLAAIAAASGGSDELDDRLRPDLQGAVRVGDQTTVEAIVHWIESSDLKVLIVDALKDAHDSEENSNQQMAQIMGTFSLICNRTGCAILILHHESSKAPADGKERDDAASPRGASALFDNARCVMRLKIHPSGLRTLVFAKVSHGAPPPPIWLAQDKERGVFSAAEPPEAVKDKNVGKVREALREAGNNGLTVAGIVEETKLSKSTVHEHLKALDAESNKGNPPRYRLPSEPSESGRPEGESRYDDNGLGDFGASPSESGDFPPSGVRTVRPKGRTGRSDARTDSVRLDEQPDIPFSTDSTS